MISGRDAGKANKRYRLSLLYDITRLAQKLRGMTVDRDNAVTVIYHYTVTIAGNNAGKDHAPGLDRIDPEGCGPH